MNKLIRVKEDDQFSLIDYLLCAKQGTKFFTQVIASNPYIDGVKQIFLFFKLGPADGKIIAWMIFMFGGP